MKSTICQQSKLSGVQADRQTEDPSGQWQAVLVVLEVLRSIDIANGQQRGTEWNSPETVELKFETKSGASGNREQNKLQSICLE